MSESFHIVCQHCSVINRIVSTRLGEKPKCGKCHQALFSAHPVELTSGNFQQHSNRNDSSTGRLLGTMHSNLCFYS